MVNRREQSSGSTSEPRLSTLTALIDHVLEGLAGAIQCDERDARKMQDNMTANVGEMLASVLITITGNKKRLR